MLSGFNLQTSSGINSCLPGETGRNGELNYVQGPYIVEILIEKRWNRQRTRISIGEHTNRQKHENINGTSESHQLSHEPSSHRQMTEVKKKSPSYRLFIHVLVFSACSDDTQSLAQF